MRCPIGVIIHLAARAGVERAFGQGDHGDAIVHGADIDAQIAGHAFLIFDGKGAIFAHGDGLVRCILAGGIAAAAFDAIILVDLGFGDVVQVQILPIGDIWHGAAHQIGGAGHALAVHIIRQARNHFLHNLKPIGHHRRANLHIARAQRHEFRRVAPCCHPANARNGQAMGGFGAGNFGHHVQRDGFDRRAAIAAMGAFAVDHRFGAEGIKVHRCDRIDRVDQRNRIRPAPFGGFRRFADIGDVGGEFHDARHPRMGFHPARDHFDIFWHLAHRAAHAALGHAMGATKVQLDAVCLGIFNAVQDVFPAFLIAGHHQRNHHSAVAPFALDHLDLVKVHLQRAVGDQLDIVQPQKAAIRAPNRAVTRPAHIDHGRAFGAKRFPHHPAPARLKGALDVIGFVRGRGRGQPKRVGRFDTDEIGDKACHSTLPCAGARAANFCRAKLRLM